MADTEGNGASTMGRIGEFASLFAVCEQVLTCRAFEDIEQNMLAPIAECLGAETSAFIQFVPDVDRGMRIGRSTATGVPNAAHQEYVRHFFPMDPAIEVLGRRRRAEQSVFCTSEICDYSKLVGGEFYNDFFRPIHIHHVLIMNVSSNIPGSRHLILGFHRPRDRDDFGEEEKNRARQLINATGCTLRAIALREELAVREETINQFEVIHPKMGVAFFDENLQLVYATPKGSEDLLIGASADGQEECAAVRLNQIRDACRSLQMKPQAALSIEINSPDWGETSAVVRAWHTAERRMLFAVHTLPQGIETKLRTVCSDFKLTHRESDILRLLISGLKNSEISKRLFISPRTVENHLRSIYSKASVNSRTQLLSGLLK